MKRCEQEIRAATKPSDIFSMDLNTIEQEKDEYLEAFKPKKYHTIENFIITRKVLILYDKAIIELNQHNDTLSIDSQLAKIDDTVSMNCTGILCLSEDFDVPRTTASVVAESISVIDSSPIYKSKATAISNYLISESILNSFRNFSFLFDLYPDEIERKNKLDEYYMLLKEIDEYDNILMNFNCIEDAYSNLELVQHPTIKVDLHSLWMLASMPTKEFVDKIMKATRHVHENPMKILSDLMSQNNIFVFDLNGKLYSRLDKGIYIPLKVKIIEEKFRKELDIRSPSIILDTSNFHFTFEEKYKLSEKSRQPCYYYTIVTVKDSETKEFILRILETIYNSLSEKHFKDLLLNDSYYEIVESINSINMDILLMNLRNLHSGLRNQVRRFKIDKAVS